MSPPSPAVVIAEPRTAQDIAAAKALFLEYAGSLSFSLGFQNFEQEMADFPGRYGPPRGALLLAQVPLDGRLQPAGAVGLRSIGPDICEMKRMYVRPKFRGLGLGEKLARGCLEQGVAFGYRAMRLDTMAESMASALRLYRALGFLEIPAYYDNPIKEAVYLECDLHHWSRNLTSREHVKPEGSTS